MKRSNYAVPALSAASILCSNSRGALVLFFTIVLGFSPASAKPKTENCDFTTIDSAKVRACEDKYDTCRVLRVVSGEAFCYSDIAGGHVDCNPFAAPGPGGRIGDIEATLEGILQTQQTTSTAWASIAADLDILKMKIYEPKVCAAHDLQPVGIASKKGPTSFCQTRQDVNHLKVIVYNQGAPEADSLGTKTHVVFNTSNVPVAYDVDIPLLGSGKSYPFELTIPTDCYVNYSCSFTIIVNANDAAEPKELIVRNITALGACNVIP